jgi:hypothetical protein
MMMKLMVAGIGLVLIGLGAIGYGIPVKEFGFGNTLILSGAIASCTGVILLALHAAVRELTNALGGREQAPAPPPFTALKRPPPPTDEVKADENTAGDDLHFAPRPPRIPADPGVIDPESTAPWQQDAARERARLRAAAPAIDPPSAPAAESSSTRPEASDSAAATESSGRARRSLLFSSSRRERERAALAAGAPPADAAGQSTDASDPRRNAFDEAWPEPDRGRSEPSRRLRPSESIASARPESATPVPEAGEKSEAPVAPAAEEPAEVTVLKRGEVDGMAYSLYSDGSIEAQMPEGMMRFASIDELRSYLDQRS